MSEFDEMPLPENMVDGVEDAIIAVSFDMDRRLKAVKALEHRYGANMTDNQNARVKGEYALYRNVNKLITYFKKTINAHLGKIPPQAIDLEEAILGAMMLEKPAWDIVKTFMQPKHFNLEAHRLIFQAALDLDARKGPVDMRTVVDQLRKNGNIEHVGGAHYIAELTSKVSSGANIEYHGRVVIEYAIRNQLLNLASMIYLNAYDDTFDALELLDQCIESVNEAHQWRKKKSHS